MSYVAINQIADLFFQIFGNGKIMALFIISFFVILLFLMRANLATILLVIIPLILAFTLNPVTTNFIDIEPYVYFSLLGVLAILFAFTIIINALKG